MEKNSSRVLVNFLVVIFLAMISFAFYIGEPLCKGAICIKMDKGGPIFAILPLMLAVDIFFDIINGLVESGRLQAKCTRFFLILYLVLGGLLSIASLVDMAIDSVSIFSSPWGAALLGGGLMIWARWRLKRASGYIRNETKR